MKMIRKFHACRTEAVAGFSFRRASLLGVLLCLAAPLAAQTGWQLRTGPQGAELSHGPAQQAGSVQLSCDADGSRLLLWVRKPPRHAEDGQEFQSALRILQHRVERLLPASGLVQPGQRTTQMSAEIADPATLLQGMAKNGRLTIIHHAGRSRAPLPGASDQADFLQACQQARSGTTG